MKIPFPISLLHLMVLTDVGSPAQLKNLLAWWAAEEVCRGICMDWDDEDRASRIVARFFS